MEYTKLSICFLSLLLTNAEIPKNICEIDYPFRKMDFTCDNFENICIKKDDETCKTFQSACKQCPPNNYTVIMYQDLLKIKNQFNYTNFKFDRLKEEISRKFDFLTDKNMIEIQKSIDINRNISIAIIILLILIIVILLLELKFKLITKLYNFISKSNQSQTDQSQTDQSQTEETTTLLQNIPDDSQRLFQNLTDQAQTAIQNLTDEAQRLFQNLTAKTQPVIQNLNDEITALIQNEKVAKMKFRIPKQMIDLNLHIDGNDNVVKLKRQISDKIEGLGPNDYKTMKMKYKGNQLDNNQYFLTCIDSPEIPIYCEYDNDNNIININEIIILKLKANFLVPDMLEIKKSQTIKNLKEIISQITQSKIENLIIMKQMDELDNNKTVEHCKLSDNDWIQVIKITDGTVLVQSIFHDIQYKFQYSLNDKVSSLKVRLANQVTCDVNNLSLFANGAYLSQDDYLYKYSFCGELVIKYCNFTNSNIYEIVQELLNKGTIKYFKGENKKTKEEILIKIYEPSNYVKDGKVIDFVSKNLLLFMKTKFHSRFIQLLSVYYYDDKIFVVLPVENLQGATLNNFIDTNWPIIEHKIAKWIKQILEGLAYIHQYGFVYKDLNPSNIFIDGNHNMKLPSFNLVDSLDITRHDNLFSNISTNLVRYVSPEILANKPSGMEADVWSLGMILIKIHTRDHPHPSLGDDKMAEMIISNSIIKHIKGEISEEFEKFIDLCLKHDANERASIDQLLQTEFFRKYRYDGYY